jgi:hypothetical protein
VDHRDQVGHHRELPATDDGEMPFDYGIYSSAVTSDVTTSKDMTTKLLFCLWWGLANLRYVTTLLQ